LNSETVSKSGKLAPTDPSQTPLISASTWASELPAAKVLPAGFLDRSPQPWCPVRQVRRIAGVLVDLGRSGSFGFLGFDFRRIRSRRGAWRANYTPQLKRRTALQRKLKDVFRRHQSQPVDRVVQLINPILRGWVNYFAVGHSSECFSFIKDWVEKKVRRHMLRARKRKGFGWTRWSRQWLYESLRLFNGYRVRRPLPKVAPAR